MGSRYGSVHIFEDAGIEKITHIRDFSDVHTPCKIFALIRREGAAVAIVNV